MPNPIDAGLLRSSVIVFRHRTLNETATRPGAARDVDLPEVRREVDPSFEVCWKCGTSPEGDEDPDFVSADDTPPIEDPLYDPIAEPDAELLAAGPAEEIAGAPVSDLVECYMALTLMEAKFLADQLAAQGIPALSDTQDFQDQLGPWDGNPRVFCRAADLPRARAWLAEYERRRKAEHGRGH